MFIAENKVRMHDTDMAGIIYFASQFRYVHDAWEDFAESIGLGLDHLFRNEDFVFVIVHAEANFLAPLKVGDLLEVHLRVTKVGTASFTTEYQIYRKSDEKCVGTAQLVHVTLNGKTRQKIDIPERLRQLLQ
jgi:1,4-dihydroxy-2-naphthoyl-CoA hydrolase